MAQDERTLNMDLPEAVADAAEKGDVDAVREWLANGGAPDANIDGLTLLEIASVSSRPSCAVIAEILCAAGARAEGDNGNEEYFLSFAAFLGAVDTVRVLLRHGASVSDTSLHGLPPSTTLCRPMTGDDIQILGHESTRKALRQWVTKA